MQRREFITLLGGAAARPLAARAQQSEHYTEASMKSKVVNLKEPKQFSTAAALAMGQTMIRSGRAWGDTNLVQRGEKLLALGKAQQAANHAASLIEKPVPSDKA